MAKEIQLGVLSSGAQRSVDIAVTKLIIAGFTGRDREAVLRHIAELRALGVPPPERTPSFYALDPEVLTQGEEIIASGQFTSGEVEPVIVNHDGNILLTVGSDHTDRDLEQIDIAVSKSACPKVIGRTCWSVEAITDWDGVSLGSAIEGDLSYQEGTLKDLMPWQETVARMADEGLEFGPGTVVFLGTVPISGVLRPTPRFLGWIQRDGTRLDVEYSVKKENRTT